MSMLRFLLNGLLVGAFVLAATVTSLGQNREKFVISAKAGGVNAVAGGALVRHASGDTWQALAATDDLNTGDTVQTNDGGLVEILLNPGSYMRVGANSEFELADASIASLRAKLNRGSAIVEATGPEEADLNINIDTPQTRLVIAKRGIYRFNVLASGVTEALVKKGLLLVNGNSGMQVKSGHKLIFSGGQPQIAKLEKGDLDSLDVWSKDRAQMLASANQGLTERRHSDAFTSFASNSWYLDHRNYFGGYGLWYFDPFFSCYSFAPFYSFWGSPYGYGYNSGIYVPIWARPYPWPIHRHWRSTPVGPAIVGNRATAIVNTRVASRVGFPGARGSSGSRGSFNNRTTSSPPMHSTPSVGSSRPSGGGSRGRN
jgi:hypothetical protein